MNNLKKAKELVEYYARSLKTMYEQRPNAISFEEAIEAIKTEKMKGYLKALNFVKLQKRTTQYTDLVKYKNVYYLGHCGQTDENDIFEKAKNVIDKTFANNSDEPIIAVYDNGGYKFYFCYHDGLNGTGDFEDYMKEAASKLGEMTKNGATFRTITDMFNDYVDDVADWLYVYRV